MKLIRQVSTGKIIYRENPYTDNTLANASSCSGIDVSDLQMVDENYSEEDWANALKSEKSWLDKRLANMENGGYGTTGEQFEMIGEQGMEVYQAHIAKVKTDIPKEI